MVWTRPLCVRVCLSVCELVAVLAELCQVVLGQEEEGSRMPALSEEGIHRGPGLPLGARQAGLGLVS